MKIDNYIFLLLLINILTTPLFAQYYDYYPFPEDSLLKKPICKKVYLGVNWHMGSQSYCSDNLYESGYIFGASIPHGYAHQARVFILNNKLDLSDLFNNNILCLFPDELLDKNYNCRMCGNDELIKLREKLNETYLFWFNLIPSYIKYRDYKMDKSGSYYYELKTNKLNEYALDKLPNYYRLSYSSDWDSLKEEYSSAVTKKLFYVAIFKCRLCYIPNGDLVNIPVPNLNLDLNSPDPEKRSLCTFENIPVSVITRIKHVKRIKPIKHR